MADSYGRHLLRTPRHLPARRSPATQSLPLQRARAERSRDPPAPRAPRAHGTPLLDVRYTKQRAVNLHRFWPRNCSKPEHLPRAYVRIVGAMLTRQLAHWHNGRHDKLAVGSGRNHRGRLPQNENAVGTYIDELAHAQACQYAALDGWTRIARAMKISWAADGGTLLGAMCYRAMPAWDDDMDLVVPQEECRKLDRIWEEARAMPGVWGFGTWQPRRTRFGVTVWRSFAGEAATNGHKKFTTWEPLTAPAQGYREHGIDVTCSGHNADFTRPGGAPVPGTPVLTAAIRKRLAHPVPFGPTTVLQLPTRLALHYIKLKGWDADCQEMPPLSTKAKAALDVWAWNITHHPWAHRRH